MKIWSMCCPLCGSTTAKLWAKSPDRLLHARELFCYWQCRRCDTLFLSPVPQATELSAHYPQCYPPYRPQEMDAPSSSSAKKRGCIRRALSKLRVLITGDLDWWWLPRNFNGNVLEIGAATGNFLERVRMRCPGVTVEGIEMNPHACQQAQQKGFKVHCGDLLNITLEQAPYDIIYLAHVFEHFIEPKKYLPAIHALLKEGGELIMITPNSNSWSACVFRSYWFALEAPRHIFIPSPRQLTATLEEEGFEEIRLKFRVYPKSFLKSVRYGMGMGQGSVPHAFIMACAVGGKIASLFKATSVMEIAAKKKTQFT